MRWTGLAVKRFVGSSPIASTKALVRGLKSLANVGNLPILTTILTTKLTPFLVVRLVVNVHLPRSRSSLTWADASPCTLNLLTIGQETTTAARSGLRVILPSQAPRRRELPALRSCRRWRCAGRVRWKLDAQ